MKKKLKKSFYILVPLIIIITLVLTIYFLILSKNSKQLVITLKENGAINYSVCVKENDYYQESCLDKGMLYIASLIDNIDINFDYQLLSDNEVDYSYTYYIDAQVSVFAKNDPSNVIYNNIKHLVNEITKDENSKKLLRINETIKVDYDEYNLLIRKFKNEYGINADSTLKIKLYVKPTIKNEQFEKDILKDQVVMELTIPLTENQINININNKEIDETKEYTTETKSMLNYFYMGISGLSLLITLTTATFFIFALTKNERNTSPYRREVGKILREYDDIITEVSTIIDPYEEEYSYADVSSFNELKNMALNTNKQIIYSELKELTTPARTWFYIVDESNKKVYRYAIRSDEKRFQI